jgi:hypothetical protein
MEIPLVNGCVSDIVQYKDISGDKIPQSGKFISRQWCSMVW